MADSGARYFRDRSPDADDDNNNSSSKSNDNIGYEEDDLMTKITTQYAGNSSCLCRSWMHSSCSMANLQLATLAHHFVDCCSDSIWHCARIHHEKKKTRRRSGGGGQHEIVSGFATPLADIQMSERLQAIEEISEDYLDALFVWSELKRCLMYLGVTGSSLSLSIAASCRSDSSCWRLSSASRVRHVIH